MKGRPIKSGDLHDILAGEDRDDAASMKGRPIKSGDVEPADGDNQLFAPR